MGEGYGDGEGEGEGEGEYWAESSQCGGFGPEELSGMYDNGEGGYCDAEVLAWSYDSETQVLRLLDQRILLNCCGDHDVTLDIVEGVYVFTEWDEPEGEGGRCNCMCVFDFAVEVTGVPEGELAINLLRVVSDDGLGEPTELFVGTLDLAEGAGAEILDDTDVGAWCEDEPLDS